MPVSSSSPPTGSRKHTVPTHLNLPDQVLTLWSFSLTARQLLLLLVGGGMSGDLWHALAFLSHDTTVGQCVRVILALLPVLLALVLAWYRYAGRPLEVWCLVLVRYLRQPRRLVWRTLRATPSLLFPQHVMVPDPNEQEDTHHSGTALHEASREGMAA